MKLHPVDVAARRRTYKTLLVDTVAKLESGGRGMWSHEYVQLSHQANSYYSCVITLDAMMPRDMWWFIQQDTDDLEHKKTR